MKSSNNQIRKGYKELAKSLEGLDTAEAKQMAFELDRYSDEMPVPKSRHEEIKDKMLERIAERQNNISNDPNLER